MASEPPAPLDGDRFDRSRRVDWLDIGRIRSARCLVAGAGALGNEAVKNLVLSGFRDLTLVDMDDVALSNLNRCLFFRESDVRSRMKADIVAERASELDPEARIVPMACRVQDLEDWRYDIAVGCLDNVAARLHLNAQACWRGIPYVDGATDGFRGRVQVVLPGGPCLQCLMNRTHAALAEARFSCTGRAHMYVPPLAAEITTTAAVAAVQAREAVKIASGRPGMCIRHVWYYDGAAGESFTAEAAVDPGCRNHQEEIRRS